MNDNFRCRKFSLWIKSKQSKDTKQFTRFLEHRLRPTIITRTILQMHPQEIAENSIKIQLFYG